MDLHSVYRLRK